MKGVDSNKKEDANEKHWICEIIEPKGLESLIQKCENLSGKEVIDNAKQPLSTKYRNKSKKRTLQDRSNSEGASLLHSEAKKPKKKGFFDKLNDTLNKVGNKLKDKIKSGIDSVRHWFNSQNEIVKILIFIIIAQLCCICITSLAILTTFSLITAVKFLILYDWAAKEFIHNIDYSGIWNAIKMYGSRWGGIVNSDLVKVLTSIFILYTSIKTFIATYKQGKKSWEIGERWSKTFSMIGMSILALIILSLMAARGWEMMKWEQEFQFNQRNQQYLDNYD